MYVAQIGGVMAEQKKPKAPDDNDRLIAGTLPEDPADGTVVVSRGPRLLTVRHLLTASSKRAQSAQKAGVITTGDWRIDGYTGGIQPGHGWILAAETSWGKSSYALAIADVNLKLGKAALIVSTEDDESIYGDRLLARRSGVSLAHIRDHTLNDDERSKITDVVAKAEPTPVYLDGRDIKEDELCRQIDAMVREYHVDLVIVDYLQSVLASRQYQDERVRFRETAQRITHTCKAIKVPLIICSQITPDDSGKIPGKYRVRESKDVVHAAEAVLIGFELQNDWQNKRDPSQRIEAGTKCINIDKAKCGKKAIVALRWNALTATFEPQRDSSCNYLDQYRDPAELDDDYVGGNPDLPPVQEGFL
jgi:replicative DNA helicase